MIDKVESDKLEFNKIGFTVIKNALSVKDVDALKTFLEKRINLNKKKFYKWLEKSNVEPKLKKSKVYSLHQKKLPYYAQYHKLPKDLEHYLVGEFDVETRTSKKIQSFLSKTKFVNSIKNFTNLNRFLIKFPPSPTFTKGEKTSSVPLHQDWIYNQSLSDFVTVWIPLVTITDKIGGLVFYEGSHMNKKIEHIKGKDWDFEFELTKIKKFKRTHAKVKKGDLLLFHPYTLHKSAPHTSNKKRMSMNVRVFGFSNKVTSSYFDPQSRKITRGTRSK